MAAREGPVLLLPQGDDLVRDWGDPLLRLQRQDQNGNYPSTKRDGGGKDANENATSSDEKEKQP